MTATPIDNAIRLALHYTPRGITIHDVLLYAVGVTPMRDQVKARLVALAQDGEIEATPQGWVAAHRGADAAPDSSEPSEREKL